MTDDTAGSRTKGMRQAWKEFKTTMDGIKSRITALKVDSERKEKEAKLKSIQESIRKIN